MRAAMPLRDLEAFWDACVFMMLAEECGPHVTGARVIEKVCTLFAIVYLVFCCVYVT